MVCASGSCGIYLERAGLQQEIRLCSPRVGVEIPPLVWTVEYDFSPGAALAVLASHDYDESDYWRSYAAYIVEGK